eukprot:964934-Prymnesium_polylepis.1
MSLSSLPVRASSSGGLCRWTQRTRASKMAASPVTLTRSRESSCPAKARAAGAHEGVRASPGVHHRGGGGGKKQAPGFWAAGARIISCDTRVGRTSCICSAVSRRSASSGRVASSKWRAAASRAATASAGCEKRSASRQMAKQFSGQRRFLRAAATASTSARTCSRSAVCSSTPSVTSSAGTSHCPR